MGAFITLVTSLFVSASVQGSFVVSLVELAPCGSTDAQRVEGPRDANGKKSKSRTLFKKSSSNPRNGVCEELLYASRQLVVLPFPDSSGLVGSGKLNFEKMC